MGCHSASILIYSTHEFGERLMAEGEDLVVEGS